MGEGGKDKREGDRDRQTRDKDRDTQTRDKDRDTQTEKEEARTRDSQPRSLANAPFEQGPCTWLAKGWTAR